MTDSFNETKRELYELMPDVYKRQPLPFVSYGATGMVMNFIMLGMIGSVWTHNIQKQR